MSGDFAAAVSVCTRCQAELSLIGLRAGDIALCARCGNAAPLPPAKDTRRVSKKAVFSVIFGAMGFLISCLGGIPALVLGIWALLDIRRRDDELKGRTAAIVGISLGAVTTFLCGPMSIAVLLPAVQQLREAQNRMQSTQQVTASQDVRAVADQIGSLKLPSALFPVRAETKSGGKVKKAAFGSFSPSAMVLVARLRGDSVVLGRRQLVGAELDDMGASMPMNVLSQRTLTWTIAGQPEQVLEQTGIDQQTNLPARRYQVVLERGSTLYGLKVCTLDEPAADEPPRGEGDPSINLTVEEVQAVLESFRPVP